MPDDVQGAKLRATLIASDQSRSLGCRFEDLVRDMRATRDTAPAAGFVYGITAMELLAAHRHSAEVSAVVGNVLRAEVVDVAVAAGEYAAAWNLASQLERDRDPEASDSRDSEAEHFARSIGTQYLAGRSAEARSRLNDRMGPDEDLFRSVVTKVAWATVMLDWQSAFDASGAFGSKTAAEFASEVLVDAQAGVARLAAQLCSPEELLEIHDILYRTETCWRRLGQWGRALDAGLCAVRIAEAGDASPAYLEQRFMRLARCAYELERSELLAACVDAAVLNRRAECSAHERHWGTVLIVKDFIRADQLGHATATIRAFLAESSDSGLPSLERAEREILKAFVTAMTTWHELPLARRNRGLNAAESKLLRVRVAIDQESAPDSLDVLRANELWHCVMGLVLSREGKFDQARACLIDGCGCEIRLHRATHEVSMLSRLLLMRLLVDSMDVDDPPLPKRDLFELTCNSYITGCRMAGEHAAHHPGLSNLHRLMAEAFSRTGRKKEADEMFQRFVRQRSESVREDFMPIVPRFPKS